MTGQQRKAADDELRASVGVLVEQVAELVKVLRPVAERLAGTIETSPAGRDTESSPGDPAVATTGQPGDERAEAIAGLRELCDFLDEHPEVPFDRYDPRIQIYVSNRSHMQGKDEPAKFAELARIGEALGVEADLRDEPGLPHPHAVKRFRGGASYEAIYVTKAYRRGYEPADETATESITGGEEVAGSDGRSGPATAPADEAEHYHVGGAAGGPGENDAECACGVAFGGFDTHAEATAALDRHIAEPVPADEATHYLEPDSSLTACAMDTWEDELGGVTNDVASTTCQGCLEELGRRAER